MNCHSSETNIIALTAYNTGDKSGSTAHHVQNSVQQSPKILAPYVDGNIGDHQSGFRRNRSTTGHIYFSFLYGEKM
jgi:hypothetical protein